jgi:hypothetical protein
MSPMSHLARVGGRISHCTLIGEVSTKDSSLIMNQRKKKETRSTATPPDPLHRRVVLAPKIHSVGLPNHHIPGEEGLCQGE